MSKPIYESLVKTTARSAAATWRSGFERCNSRRAHESPWALATAGHRRLEDDLDQGEIKQGVVLLPGRRMDALTVTEQRSATKPRSKCCGTARKSSPSPPWMRRTSRSPRRRRILGPTVSWTRRARLDRDGSGTRAEDSRRRRHHGRSSDAERADDAR